MPHSVVLLVDTYDTLRGVEHAIEIGKKLRANNSSLYGIRLDSGDNRRLSIQARAMLDAAGFQDTQIMASNSLDEYAIQRFKAEGAKISVWAWAPTSSPARIVQLSTVFISCPRCGMKKGNGSIS